MRLDIKLAAFVLFAPLACGQAAYSATPSGWQPSTNVEIISAASAGSVHDRLARITMRLLQEEKLVSTPLTVVNRQGGGGAIALSFLEQRRGNPHYFTTMSGTLSTSHITGSSKFNYSDFTLLAVMFDDFNIFSVRGDSPIKNGADLLAKLKADAKSVSFAFAPALGNYNHIAVARLAKAANADVSQLRTVVFDGGGKAATALLGGHVDVLVGGAGNVVGHIQSSKVRALGYSAPQRNVLKELSSVPTWREQGVDLVSGNPYFFLGPKELKQIEVEYWGRLFEHVTKSAEWKSQAERNSWFSLGLSGAAGKKYLDEQYGEYKSTLHEIGLAK